MPQNKGKFVIPLVLALSCLSGLVLAMGPGTESESARASGVLERQPASSITPSKTLAPTVEKAKPAAAPAKAISELEIKSYRFQRHGNKYERLVFEFKGKGLNKGTETNVNYSGGNEATVSLSKATIDGAIPESAINDSISAKSHLVTSVMFNTDDPTQVSLKANLKAKVDKISAFWLKTPTRLVIDVYAPVSEMADEDNHAKKESARAPSSETPQPLADKDFKSENYLCFRSGTQVAVAIGFRSRRGFEEAIVPENQGANSSREGIVCYPKVAQVTATVYFVPITEEHPKDAPKPNAKPAAPVSHSPITGIPAPKQPSLLGPAGLGLPRSPAAPGAPLVIPSPTTHSAMPPRPLQAGAGLAAPLLPAADDDDFESTDTEPSASEPFAGATLASASKFYSPDKSSSPIEIAGS